LILNSKRWDFDCSSSIPSQAASQPSQFFYAFDELSNATYEITVKATDDKGVKRVRAQQILSAPTPTLPPALTIFRPLLLSVYFSRK
jgi:hypothetical protein